MRSEPSHGLSFQEHQNFQKASRASTSSLKAFSLLLQALEYSAAAWHMTSSGHGILGTGDEPMAMQHSLHKPTRKSDVLMLDARGEATKTRPRRKARRVASNKYAKYSKAEEAEEELVQQVIKSMKQFGPDARFHQDLIHALGYEDVAMFQRAHGRVETEFDSDGKKNKKEPIRMEQDIQTLYIVEREGGLPVYKNAWKGSEQIGLLPKGAKFETLQVAALWEEDEERAFIKEPLGWVSLRNWDETWARQERDDLDQKPNISQMNTKYHYPHPDLIDPTDPTSWGFLEVGIIGAPHGVHGEVKVLTDSDFASERLCQPGPIWLKDHRSAHPKSYKIKTGRKGPGYNKYLVQFEGVSDRAKARKLRGYTIWTRRELSPVLGTDDVMLWEFMGMNVSNAVWDDELEKWTAGELLGHIVGVYSADEISPRNPELAQDLIQLRHAKDGERNEDRKGDVSLVPVVDEIFVVFDVRKKVILMKPPIGLLDIIEPPEKEKIWIRGHLPMKCLLTLEEEARARGVKKKLEFTDLTKMQSEFHKSLASES